MQRRGKESKKRCPDSRLEYSDSGHIRGVKLVTDFTIEDMRGLFQEEINKALASSFKSPDELLTRVEAAAYLQVKPNTLAVWAMKGKGPAPTKLGSSTRYRRSVLDQFINDNTMPR